MCGCILTLNPVTNIHTGLWCDILTVMCFYWPSAHKKTTCPQQTFFNLIVWSSKQSRWQLDWKSMAISMQHKSAYSSILHCSFASKQLYSNISGTVCAVIHSDLSHSSNFQLLHLLLAVCVGPLLPQLVHCQPKASYGGQGEGRWR